MKKTVMSLAAMTFLSTSALQADDATSIEEAFKSGATSGDVTLYGERVNNNGETPDSGFSMGSIGLGFESGSYKNFKVSVAFRANHDFNEKEESDYSDGTEPDAIMSVANISYENDMLALILGRQEMDIEWMGDFHEAYTGVLKLIPDTEITLSHSDRIAVADPDAPLEDFERVNSNEGLNVIDVKYEGIKDTVFNAYYYHAEDTANWYGVKADYDSDIFGVTAHYAKSNEKVADTNNGSIAHLETRAAFVGVSLSAGYIKTDKDGAIGSMNMVGDNVNPLEEGNQVYEADADTYYAGISYEILGVSLGAIYGNSDYSDNKDESEINITAKYAFNDAFSVSGLYAGVDADEGSDDYDKFTLTLVYNF